MWGNKAVSPFRFGPSAADLYVWVWTEFLVTHRFTKVQVTSICRIFSHQPATVFCLVYLPEVKVENHVCVCWCNAVLHNSTEVITLSIFYHVILFVPSVLDTFPYFTFPVEAPSAGCADGNRLVAKCDNAASLLGDFMLSCEVPTKRMNRLD